MNAALEKRIKRQIIGKQHRFLAVSPLGFEQTLVRELEYIRQEDSQEGASSRHPETQSVEGSSATPPATQPHVTGDGKVEFTAKITEAWKVIAFSRIANRVLMEVANFKAENFRELEKKAGEIPWELYLEERTAFDLQTKDDNHARRATRPTQLGMAEPNGWDKSEAKVQRRETKDEKYLSSNSELVTSNSINIHVTCKHSRLYHSDAIAERLQKIIDGGSLPLAPSRRENGPSVLQTKDERKSTEAASRLDYATPSPKGSAPKTPPQNLYVNFLDDRCTIWFDLAGEELYKRGHERFVNDAPLKETIAAAMLFEAFDATDQATNNVTPDPVPGPPYTLLDLMSGSGTFSLEAAYIANKLIPGVCRDFALKHHPAFKEATWNFITRSVTLSETKGPVKFCKAFATIKKILTSDISERAVNIIKHNIESSPLANISPAPVIPQLRDFFSYTAKEIADACGDASPVLVLNPPYGKRLDFDAPKLYTKIGKKLTELANNLAAFNKRLTVAILAPKDDTRDESKYTCTANLLRECPAISPEHNPAVKIIETSHGGISLNAIIATV
jgi:putative N6-adenine-specific DNA methylase